MARFENPTPQQEALYAAWVSARPEAIRKVAERFDPWTLYRLKTTNHRVAIQSLTEGDGGKVTMTVAVLGEFNKVAFERAVFGIDPDDLEECDLPGQNEEIGTAMTPEQVEQNIDTLRVMVRPDLWEMGADGIARRKDN